MIVVQRAVCFFPSVIGREIFRLYFPLAACLLLSLALSLVVWLVRLFRG